MLYNPPFPWFGGKRLIADIVWRHLGDVAHYVEPFFGSGAVLFMRPHPPKIETVNDLDRFVVNFWRAVQHDPEQVAHYADNPVFEDDLTARHIWLVKHGISALAERVPADPEYYDPKIAGWWVWGICSWIGSSWCAGTGPWTEEDGKIIKMERGNREVGVSRRLPHLGNPGMGVKRKLPHLGDAGVGVNVKDNLIEYMASLAERLHRVRICNGDWSRIVTKGALHRGSTVGVFLDPPYNQDVRDRGLYNNDRPGIAAEVLQWCKDNGDNARYRIILAGYEGEHNDLESLGWRKIAWKAGRSYGNSTSKNENPHLERLWINANCISDCFPFPDVNTNLHIVN